MATNGSNLLNSEDVKDYAYSLSCRANSEAAQAWVNQVFKNWLLHNKAFQRLCLPAHEQHSLWLKLLPDVLDAPSVKEIHYVEVTPDTPDWVTRGMQALSLNFFQAPARDSEDHAKFVHLVDYLNAQKKISLRMTVEDAEAGARRWDKQLARQKFMSDYHEGVLVCESDAFDGLEDLPVLVKLTTEAAYKNEGAAQSNCVASYVHKADSEIYSLRVPGDSKALATIEVKHKNVVQVKGPRNAQVSTPVQEALKVWAEQSGFTWFKTETYDRARSVFYGPLDELRRVLDQIFASATYPVRVTATRPGQGRRSEVVQNAQTAYAFSRSLNLAQGLFVVIDNLASINVQDGIMYVVVLGRQLTLYGTTFFTGQTATFLVDTHQPQIGGYLMGAPVFFGGGGGGGGMGPAIGSGGGGGEAAYYGGRGGSSLGVGAGMSVELTTSRSVEGLINVDISFTVSGIIEVPERLALGMGRWRLTEELEATLAGREMVVNHWRHTAEGNTLIAGRVSVTPEALRDLQPI